MSEILKNIITKSLGRESPYAETEQIKWLIELPMTDDEYQAFISIINNKVT